MKWVTRERPKTDRIACPWLIKNFIDSEAEFLYVPTEQVLEVAEREGAHSYDAPNAEYSHRDGLCSFEVLLEEYELDEPALQLLARIVHAADVADDRDATPQPRRPCERLPLFRRAAARTGRSGPASERACLRPTAAPALQLQPRRAAGRKLHGFDSRPRRDERARRAGVAGPAALGALRPRA